MARVPRPLRGVAIAALALTACAGDPASSSPSTANSSSPSVQPTITTEDPMTDTTEPPVAPTTPASSTPESSATESGSEPGPGGVVDLDALQRVLDEAHAGLPAQEATLQAAVRSTSRGLDWSASSGPDAQGSVRPLRAASVGKTITAATVLELSSQGAFGLDDPVRSLLTAETVALLGSDGYDLDAITPRHLLVHTSGLYDYGFGEGSPFLTQALSDRDRRWTRREQLELAVDVGAPLWAPGTAFAYSDTGYVLLGEIVEVATGVAYHEAAREVLDFERLGIERLWLEAFEPAPDDLQEMSRSFLLEEEISDLDFSLDAFGGGGYAGTTGDFARWFEALLGGPDGRSEVFGDPSVLDTLLTIPDTNAGLEEFGVVLGDGAHGVYRLDVAGRECWSHRGFLGTIALTCPADDVTVVVSTNTALTDPLPIATALVELALTSSR